MCKCIWVCLLKAKTVSLFIREPTNNQLNFAHLKCPRNLEAVSTCAGNTKKGFMGKMVLELWLKGEKLA